ncbi:MAG: hypothetical protein R2824_20530 [Saprospiraceae bacterium]
MILTYFIIPGQFDFRRVGFLFAVAVAIGFGFYHHAKARSLAKELESTLLENQLLDQ